MATTHIPAWKKLGLKLKNQSSNSIPSSPPIDISSAGATPRKRKFGNEENVNESPSATKKKTKRTLSTNGDREPVTNGHDDSITLEQSHQSDMRRKSVTFSPDTKVEDGNSSKRLVQAAYASRLARLTGADEQDIEAATEQLNGSSVPQTNGTSISQANGSEALSSKDKEGSKSNLKVKKKQAKKLSAQPSTKVEAARQRKKIEQVIQYLNEYKNEHDTWKFNKSRQVAVLKMALDVQSLPAEHDQALKLYIQGLQGGAARQSLRKNAKEVIEQSSNDTNGVSTDNVQVSRANLILEALGAEDAMETAIVKQDETDEDADTEKMHASVPRPTATTNGVSHKQSHTPKTNALTNGTTNGLPPKKKNRRRAKKKRNISDSDDSSSSSSSDSDSDSDSDD